MVQIAKFVVAEANRSKAPVFTFLHELSNTKVFQTTPVDLIAGTVTQFSEDL